MKYYVGVLFIFLTLQSNGQNNIVDFKIKIPSSKTSNSLYNNILVLDERADTGVVGIIKKGALNREVTVVAVPILSEQVQNLVKSATDETAGNGRLVLLLKEYGIYEVTGFSDETGYCHIKAMLFAETQGGYLPVAHTDTIYVVKAFDVTKDLMRLGKAVLPDFVLDHLQTIPEGEEKFTLNDLEHFDSILKRNIPLYRNDSLLDGIYETFKSFKMQKPEITDFRAFFKKDKFQYLALPDKKGKYEKPAPDNNYAFVYRGRPYIMTGEGVYPVEKKNGDFYFKGKFRVSKSGGMVPFLLFGVMGVLIQNNYSVQTGTVIINYENGGFVPQEEPVK